MPDQTTIEDLVTRLVRETPVQCATTGQTLAQTLRPLLEQEVAGQGRLRRGPIELAAMRLLEARDMEEIEPALRHVLLTIAQHGATVDPDVLARDLAGWGLPVWRDWTFTLWAGLDRLTDEEREHERKESLGYAWDRYQQAADELADTEQRTAGELAEARRERDAALLALNDLESMRQIAGRLGLSHSRVQQMIEQARRDRA